MAHEIENVNGVASMMYSGSIPWHGLGQAVEKEVTWAAAAKLAGLDRPCEKRPIYLSSTKQVDGIPVIGTEVKEAVAVVRIDDNRILGVVSPRYHIIQNTECFELVNEIVGSGQALFHTAASLCGGRRIFCTLKFPKDAKIGPDLINMYLLMTSTHDGKSALHLRWTPVRVVCNNTLNTALGYDDNIGGTPASFNIVHTKNYETKIQQARMVLKLTEQYYAKMEHEFNKLLLNSFTESDMTKLTKQLFPSDKEPVAGVTKNKRDLVVSLFLHGAGNDQSEVKNTRWAAFNAVTDFVDHHIQVVSGDTELAHKEARMNSSSFGNGARLRQKAFELLKV
jgi:phage/plasmid-like protein (TIGR03299 family)